ncbi:MAG: ribokinase [Verrucomicrobia bacterium]|nr:ribokinase [Verrucomicrobiota bacterium]
MLTGGPGSYRDVISQESFLADYRKALSRRGRVTVVGSSNTDLVLTSATLPGPGQTVLAGPLRVHAGGKGANQAVAAVRAGARVSFVASIGRDAYGDQSVERLRREGIQLDAIHRPSNATSGVALILVDAVGQNMISVARGSNDALPASLVRRALGALVPPHVLVLQLEIPMPAVAAALTIAERAGIPAILNPAPARSLPPALLRKVHTLIPNETELAFLTGARSTSNAAIERAALTLARKGVGQVIVTCGARGVCWARNDLVLWTPALKSRVVDTTGAGDCFTGCFAAAMAAGLPTREAIEFAVRAAGISVERKGAQPSMPTLKEILARR